VASNGEDGLKMGLAEDYDVAILDLNLPGVDGLEIGRVLNTRTPRPYIIAHTAFSRAVDRARTTAAGFDLHLSKGSENSLEMLEGVLTQLAEKGSLPPGHSPQS
jgi:CheY-like chemotaxis protein